MDQHPYWQKQTFGNPLFEEIEWSRPEQKARAGKLAIIGGHGQGFAAVGESYTVAREAGVGEIRVLLPDVLKKTISASLPEALFLPSNPSNGFSQDAWPQMQAAAEWADGILLPGDAGRNSETAILYEKLVQQTQLPITLTRDAVDLLKNVYTPLVERPQTLLVVSFAQLQKIFSSVYYPKVLTFSMPLVGLVEALHKFTLSYPVTIAVLHNDVLLVAEQGNVSSTPWKNTLAIWRGQTAAKASVYWLWNKTKAFEAVTTSLITAGR
ncbi:MAG: hypothetical protein ACR2KZ_20965 [Segetibacter sp.]